MHSGFVVSGKQARDFCEGLDVIGERHDNGPRLSSFEGEYNIAVLMVTVGFTLLSVLVVGMTISHVFFDAVLVREPELVEDHTGVDDSEFDRLTWCELELRYLGIEREVCHHDLHYSVGIG